MMMMMMMKVERRHDDDDASGDRLRSSIGDKDEAVHGKIRDDDIFPMMLLLFCLSVSAGIEIY